MVTISISYSHADEELRRQLDVHLAGLRRQGVVDIWHDRKILAGEEFADEIEGALSKARIILLLVSADFISWDYCFSIEMTEALQRHECHDAVVIPVILRACDWHDLPFGKLRAMPTVGEPVRLFADLDSALLEVVRDIKAAALEIAETKRSCELIRQAIGHTRWAPGSLWASSARPEPYRYSERKSQHWENAGLAAVHLP